MRYRNVTILSPVDLVTASGTKVININIKDIISRITLYWQVTLAGEGMDGYQHLDITKIELVDGSDVLFSLNGGQAQALNIYDRKVPTMNYKQKYDGNSMASTYALDFGRFLHDPMLALDPARFRNLQLKISYNEALADTGASAHEMEIRADVFDEYVPSPIGFLMAKEHYAATPPSSGYTYIDLPTDHVLRKLLVQGYYKDNSPYSIVTEVRLDEDNEKRIPFDWITEKYYRIMQGVWTPVEDEIVGLASAAGRVFYVTATDYYTMAYVASVDAGSPDAVVDAWQSGGKITVINSGGGLYFFAHTKGYLPNHCFEFPFGDSKDIDDWYDITKLGSLRLRLKSGGANGTHAAILQQLRRY